MTRKELAKAISEKTGLPRKDAEAAVAALIATIRESLLAGEPIILRGFGTFGLRYQRARKGRLIRTGQEVLIPPRVRIYFEPSDILQDAVAQRKELVERFAPK
ncbi:MAG: HU family DNA-binding protein [Bacteroidia bacterium]|nr:HU family DNA-binding protein [Bacteroidia bacterium]MDW8014741.1 HU family DNA-binding protein [Bacteroidia bacterium]